MTIKLYENNAMLKSCQAVVTGCTTSEGQFLVELDQTVFFPEGGGQLSDRGKLGEANVLHVSEKEGHIYHHCDKALEAGSTVEAVLDWKVRLDRMQQHLGEHLLSFACWKLFKANNVGFHMNEDNVTIDLDVELSDEQLLEAELLTNEIIWENRPVHIDYLDSSEAAKLKDKMRKFNSKLTGILRIVSVENADICTCCGTHPPYTGMLGSVKIIRHEKHKAGCRVEFLCGRRALLDADWKNKELLSMSASFSTKPELLAEHIAKFKEEVSLALADVKSKLLNIQKIALQDLYNDADINADGTKLLILPMENYDAKDIKALLPEAAALEHAITLLVAVKPERISYAAVLGANAQGDCREIMKLLNKAFDGRGGGKADCAQGGSDYVSDWQERLAKLREDLLK